MIDVFKLLKNTQVEGPGKRFCIWVQGCKKHCPNCWAKDTWEFGIGTKYSVDDLFNQIKEVQDIVRDQFTFRFDFIGSAQLNMITKDIKSNVGYDFDVNIRVNDEEENYSAEEIKHILINAFNQVVRNYGYSYCEDNTRVFTIKEIDYFNSRILHSCDFAVVYDCSDGRQY